jgi:hypothetical protein
MRTIHGILAFSLIASPALAQQGYVVQSPNPGAAHQAAGDAQQSARWAAGITVSLVMARVSGPPIAARAGRGGPDTPGHDGRSQTRVDITPAGSRLLLRR